MKEHLPVRIYFRANGEANSYSLINQAGDKWLLALLVNGEHTTARQAEILEEMQRRWNVHDQLVKACEVAVRFIGDTPVPVKATSSGYTLSKDMTPTMIVMGQLHGAIKNATGEQP
jgi:hypothetical protein